MESRPQLLRRGLLLAVLSILWNTLEGIVAILAGAVAGSVALIGFGVDSVIEIASAVVVGWRLYREYVGASVEVIEIIERRAARIAGALLFFLALYILIDAGSRLLGFGEHAKTSPVGIALTAVSLIVMPLLARGKLVVAGELESHALRADAYETIACVWLSLTTLIGLVLNAVFGWWWADPLAALGLIPLIVKEALESWRGESC